MSPYIQRQVRQSKDRIEAKLDRDLVRKLERYCEYLESDRDYVIAQALAIAFRKDKGFLHWLLSQPDPQSQEPTVPSKKSSSAEKLA